ncbi:uncharacterized protein PV07_03504 [Cladophialophora immunda]|uniref:Transcription factor domain-containing protein n=1 Tax=Cladophialophora immunda TaxID=569365 RepID=A0A0D2B2M6_9EURO|nr:uncharacterized protein PV07_03504 [Cladophialophora immunda]KIW31917.1 hypothetical protein PV07_03504 [Cladophialophora immunda]OQU98352.1 Fungal specific transcription factor domain-containing protein [Cladophialophora immunda]
MGTPQPLSTPEDTSARNASAAESNHLQLDPGECERPEPPDPLTPVFQRSPETISSIDDEESDMHPPDAAYWQFDDNSLGNFLEPLFDTPGEHIAFMYYTKHLSGILAPYDDLRNPYQKLAVFAIGSPVLLHTLVSIATEWMLLYGRSNAKLASARQSKALTSIQKLLVEIESGQADTCGHLLTASLSSLMAAREAALSAILMQIAHAIYSGSAGGKAHIQCAYHLLDQLGYLNQLDRGFLPRLTAQRFAIADVAASLLHATRPKAPLTFPVYQDREDLDLTEPSFCQMTGCPQPVLSALAHISHLACDLREKRQTTDAVLGQAEQLEFGLRTWAAQKFPCLLRHGSGSLSELRYDPDRDGVRFGDARRYQMALVNQSYYWLAQLLLQRRLYRDSKSSRRVQQTVKRLIALINAIPPGQPPASALPLAFYLVARECVSDEDRNWIRERHRQMKETYRSSTRDNLMLITERIWSAEGESQRASRCANNEAEVDDFHDELFSKQLFQVIF